MSFKFIIALVSSFSVVVTLITLALAAIRNKRYPEKHFKNNLINVILTPMRFFKMGPFKDGSLTVEKALKYAMRKTKLTDFGTKDFINSYNAIMNSATHKAQKFSNLGYISARIELNMTFVRRLKFIEYLKTNPDVVKVPLRSPVFVMGLPRTGTTFIHRLLSLDPAVRAPLLWELIASVPGVDGKQPQEVMNQDLDKRRKFVKKLIDTRMSMGDNALKHIHEVGYDLPEECIMALSDELPINLQYLYTDYIESALFKKTTEGEITDNAYVYYRKMLQLLSYQIGERDDPRRWVLKCPVHLFYIKHIAHAFPDAKLIWTHRHPVSAVPSLCSLLKSVHQVYFERECRDDNKLGSEVHRTSSELLLQAQEDLDESKLECTHVLYNDLVSKPIETVKSIYKQYGWEFTAEYEKILTDYLEENRREREAIKQHRNKTGEKLHTYEPEEFGLTAQQLSEGNYAKYIAKYNVPMSKN